MVSYCTDSVTLQSVTSDGMNYSYSDDIRMRSIQSSLAYTNVMLNMHDIFLAAAEKLTDGRLCRSIFPVISLPIGKTLQVLTV